MRDGMKGWGRRLLVVSVSALLAASGCGRDVEGAADITGDSAADVVVGTGPASPCGGYASGVWVSGGGLSSVGIAHLHLEVDGAGGSLDWLAPVSADPQAKSILTAFIKPGIDSVELRLLDGGSGVDVEIIDRTTNSSVSGDVFDDVNNGWGGPIVHGRVCFDAAPESGQPLAGTWVFLVSVGESETLHRVQGTFSVPGAGVSTSAGSLLLDSREASITID